MSVRFIDADGLVELLPSHEHRGTDEVQLHDAEVSALVERMLRDPIGRLRLRALIEAASPATAQRDADVVARVRRLVAERRIVGVRVALWVRPAGTAEEARPLVPAEPASPERPAPEQPHFIEIELVGDDDQPIPSVRCRVEVETGRVYEGRTNDAGIFRVDGLEQGGTCEVSFPDLDAEAWEAA